MEPVAVRIRIRDIEVDIVRKQIKNLHLGVYPPDGRVRVAAPIGTKDDVIRLAIVSKLGWIRRRQAGFARQVRQSAREYISGESHYVAGQRYLLDVVEAGQKSSVQILNNRSLELRVPASSSLEKRRDVLHQWYRLRLYEQVPALREKWEPIIGVESSQVRIKKMKTRWGSCSISARRIWLNLELAKKPTECLEYIFVHEMVHLLERHHDARFRRLMDEFMPQWRLSRDLLNQSPLAYEHWLY